MDSGDFSALIAAERRRAADMFDGLRGEQWAAQRLCAEWTVRHAA
jgi:Mycothiol maleylpyruvate isomerase N-terminal domain